MKVFMFLSLLSIAFAAYEPCLNQFDGYKVKDFSGDAYYFVCEGGQIGRIGNCTEEVGGSDGYTIFNEELQKCIKTYSCPDPNMEDELSLPTTFHAPKSCARYVVCVDGQAFVRECPPNLIWDNVLQNCNLPDQAACYET